MLGNRIVFTIFAIFSILLTTTLTAQEGYAVEEDIPFPNQWGGTGSTEAESETVPTWIKTTMQFWVDGHTSDTEFLSTVEFLANENLIRVTDAEIRKDITVEDHENSGNTGSWDTEMVSMNSVIDKIDNHEERLAEIESARYNLQLGGQAQASPDSFFDIFTEMQHTADSFFDVFFNVKTPRTNECVRDQELVFDVNTSTWKCSSANTADSFFDVFFDVATESAENSDDVAELERKVADLERKIIELENTNSAAGT